MDIFDRLQNLYNRGIIIDCVAVNQIDNGYDLEVEAGLTPLITYTVEVMYDDLEIIYQESCDTFKEAILLGIKYAENIK